MPPRGLQKRFKDYSLAIKEDISPYHLRHVFALEFLRNGGNVFSLQRIMGHDSLEMTNVYVNLASSDIQEQHTKASPLINLLGANKRVKKL
jgi:site-specific recombinase XerD